VADAVIEAKSRTKNLVTASKLGFCNRTLSILEIRHLLQYKRPKRTIKGIMIRAKADPQSLLQNRRITVLKESVYLGGIWASLSTIRSHIRRRK